MHSPMPPPPADRLGVEPRGGLSQVRGPDEPALSRATIFGLLRGHRGAISRPSSGGLSRTGRALELARVRSRGLAPWPPALAALGLRHGDRLGIWSPNRAEWVVTQFATARIGVILVNINPAYRLAELTTRCRSSGCRAVVSAERLKTSAYLEMLESGLGPNCRRSSSSSAWARPDLRHAEFQRDRRDGPQAADRAARPRLPRGDQHPVHQRHHRHPEGRDADAPQRRQQRPIHR